MKGIFQEICKLLIKMTHNLQRPISVYRLPNSQTFTINVFLEKSGIWFCISKGETLNGVELYVYPTISSFHLHVIKNFPQKKLFRKWLPDEKKYYSVQDIKPDSNAYRILNFFRKLLKNPQIVRVDPYDRDKVLIGEETDTDLFLATACTRVEDFEEALKATKLKPGIVKLAKPPRVSN